MPGSCDPFRQNHKRLVADTLFSVYGDTDDKNLFLSIGKVTQWSGLGTDQNPPASVDSVRDDTDLWRGLFAHKRIDRSDVSLVVRRYDWTPSVVYTAYRDDLDLFDDFDPAPFYVLVDEERVYKCIDNANGAASLVAPTHTDSQIRKLSDGYRWKFLYQIPESKRGFLTKTQGDSIGYMPVEFVEYLRLNDERILQWNVQQAAVDGEIAFIKIDPDVQPFVVSDSCIFPSATNTIVTNVPVGATGLTMTSPSLILKPDYYNEMVLSIDSGHGQGQRRRITSFTPSGVGGAAFVSVDSPFSVSLSGGGDPSTFSIVPNITVVGDGTSYDNTYNPYSTAAEVTVRFGATADFSLGGATACADFFETRRLVDSIELVDGGQDYTFATLNFVKGLIVPTAKVNLDSLATAVMSPPGGHGSNPVRELGCSSMMISKEYAQNEDGKVSAANEFRQFSLILNPLLAEKQVRLRFFQAGVSGSFTEGLTAQQSTGGGVFDAAYGEIASWREGSTGHSGTNELTLTDIRGGDFEYGGQVNGLTILRVDERTVAGTESRRLVRLTLSPVGSQFSISANDFTKGYLVHGVGDYSTSMPPSRASGDIYGWEPQAGTLISGFLYVENPIGSFKVGERVTQSDQFLDDFSFSLSGIGQITAIDTVIREGVDAYDQTTSLVMAYDGATDFTSTSFPEDLFLDFHLGSTGSANGYVMDWVTAGAGTTGTLRVSGTQGTFRAGMTAAYGSDIATVTSVIHEGELKYRSGEVLYIQNMKPIQRDLEQREEIKIVIDF
jgi:hypothetical protein